MFEYTAEVIVELAMNGGADMLTGETLFSQMPTEFDSYEAFEQAFYSILGDIIEFTKGTILQQNAYHMQINPSPVYSGSLSSCVEKGRDIFDGGTKYHNTSIKCCGIATVVDSLLMVKEYVFERKLLSFAELRRILLADWVGHEELRCIIRQNRMKYGNHLRQADELSHDIYKYAASKIVGQPNHSGGVFRMGTDSITNCVVFGGRMGATPDGRKQGDPISKNFCATNGMDRNGVTALFQSVTEMDTDDFVNGAVTDFILHPSAVQGVLWNRRCTAMRVPVFSETKGSKTSIFSEKNMTAAVQELSQLYQIMQSLWLLWQITGPA